MFSALQYSNQYNVRGVLAPRPSLDLPLVCILRGDYKNIYYTMQFMWYAIILVVPREEEVTRGLQKQYLIIRINFCQ